MYSKVSTQQIGDGKLPNKYWVSISDDYGVQKGNVVDWASDSGLVKGDGKTLKVFTSYLGAKKFADELYLGQDIDGIPANTITIEDRISGEVYNRQKILQATTGVAYEDEHEDMGFTNEELKKRSGGKTVHKRVRSGKSRTSGMTISGMR